MTIERLREAFQTLPFRPFRVHLADGRDISIRHREFLVSQLGGRTIIVVQPDGRMNVIDLLPVTDLFGVCVMMGERLRELRLAIPFQPFDLLLKDGLKIAVKRADQFAIVPEAHRLVILDDPKDRLHILEISAVSDVKLRPRRKLATKGKRK